jgi:murein DD-endopeptidase MepM/ murein hydrolase activator NlpD
LFLYKKDNSIFALVGISVKSKPRKGKIVLQKDGKKIKEIEFEIKDKAYLEQHIKLKNKNKVTPNKKEIERIIKEINLSKKAYAFWSEDSLLQKEYIKAIKPLDSGIITGVFGSRRVFNGKKRNPHSGIDIATPAGKNIYSVLPGKVLLVGDFFFNGKCVFVDHGFGLVSVYFHLKDFIVKIGDTLKSGEVLGHVGSTGRATGPHLHFGISLNGERVDPELFFKKNELKNFYNKW